MNKWTKMSLGFIMAFAMSREIAEASACGECEEPSDPYFAGAAGAPPCVPLPNGTKCGEDSECKPNGGIKGAKLVVTPSINVCKKASVKVDTGTPTDEDVIWQYRCLSGNCDIKPKKIPGTVDVKVTNSEGVWGCQSYRRYAAIFTSECGDTDINITKSIFLMDCDADFDCCTKRCDKKILPQQIASCHAYCASQYKFCRRKCKT